MPSSDFAVVSSPQASEEVHKVYQAHSPEVRRQILAALRLLDNNIRSNPFEFGEPVFHHSSLGLDVRLAFLPPLLIYFGIDRTNRRIFLKSIQLVSEPAT